jgi:hypothetical protein
MSDRVEPPAPATEEQDPALERIQEDRKPGEMETAMASGSDEGTVSATERFEGDISREEALDALDPEHFEDAREGEAQPAGRAARDAPRD